MFLKKIVWYVACIFIMGWNAFQFLVYPKLVSHVVIRVIGVMFCLLAIGYILDVVELYQVRKLDREIKRLEEEIMEEIKQKD